MLIRKSAYEDVKVIMKIIKSAQKSLKMQNVDQWQNGYPNEKSIESDISNDISYVVIKNNQIAATLAISFDGEKTYDEIHDGKWISNGEFCVIHRIAIDENYKGSGLASDIIKYVESTSLNRGVNSIKIDTHEDNIAMKKLLKKNGFKYCGIIYLEDNSKRIAFEKLF